MILRDYVEGEKLQENEFLLKLRKPYGLVHEINTGFLTKFNKDGSMPKAFNDWGKTYNDRTPLPTYVFEETFRSGWRILSWRFGQSQNWATMRHPEGFTVEIYLQQLLELIKMNTVDAGVLIGEFKWSDHKLIQKAKVII